MDCERYREILSADLDGEAHSGEMVWAATHTGSCLPCRSWVASARRVDLTVRRRVEVPDRVDDVLAALAAQPPLGSGRRRVVAVRAGLAVVGVANVIIAAFLLTGMGLAIFGTVDDHSARELAAFQAALGAAFLLAAWDGRARGRVGMVATAIVLLVGTAMADLAHSATHLQYELAHLPDIVGLGLLLALRRAEQSGPRPLARPGSRRGRLHRAA